MPGTGGDDPVGNVGTGDPGALPDQRDERDSQPLVDEIEAQLSQVDGVDRYPVPLAPVDGRCPEEVQLILTAPPSLSMRLELYQGDTALDAVETTGSEPAMLFLHPAGCADDVGPFSAVVTPVGPVVASTPYRLTRLDR